MGRSPASSCLRIIACAGGDDAAEPTSNALENKSSSDKRGWSFRKKPGKQRGLISSVVTETTPASRTRETLESALLKSPSPDNNNVSEKQTFSVDEKKSQLPVVAYVDEKKAAQSVEDKTEDKTEEKIDQLPLLVESKGTETEDDDLTGTELQANLEVPKAADAPSVVEKDITSEVETASKVEVEESEADDEMIIRKESDDEVDEKLDESVIVIIQAATRGFLARRELLKRKKVVKLQAAVRGHLVRNQAIGSLRCVQAIVKMQSLVRARHSMKDGSRVSAVSGKADANSSAQKLLENKFAKHLMETTPKTKPNSIKCDPIPTKPSSAWNWLERWMSVSKPEKTWKADLADEEPHLEETQDVKDSPQVDSVNSDSAVETETKTGSSSYEASKKEAQHAEPSETEKMSQYDSPEASAEVDHDSIQSHPLAAKDPEAEYVDEQPKHSLKRKASNPSFIAAQSKFEELTSSAGSDKATTLSSSKDGVLGEEGKTDVESSEANTRSTKPDHSVEDVAPAELDGSECGTELSVTSSLDSLDKKSDAEGADPKAAEGKLLENDTIKTDQADLIEIDVKDETPLVTVEDPKKKAENVNDEVEIAPTQHESVIVSTPDSKKRRAEDESGPQAYSVHEEASTPMTINESQATPASQASSSVKARKGKSDKSGSSQKRKVSKKITTSSPKQETGTGESNNATEQEEGREQKSGRRNSFGYDQEAREGSGGKNSLPRFMQPTQSAKAKVQEHNSPRSSPDLQERDVASVKKRHSLPVGANGKQGSPRIQRSASQAQPGTKDRKWQR